MAALCLILLIWCYKNYACMIRRTPLSRALCCHEFLSDLMGSFDYLRKLGLVRNHNLNFGFYEAFTRSEKLSQKKIRQNLFLQNRYI